MEITVRRTSGGAQTMFGGAGGYNHQAALAIIAVDGTSRITVEQAGGVIRSTQATSSGPVSVDEDVPAGIAHDFEAVVAFWTAEMERQHAAPVATPDEAEIIGDFEIAGHRVFAPGFTAETFDAAIHRAFLDGLTVAATERRNVLAITNPVSGKTYRTTRHVCECPAGRNGHGCKHRALAVAMVDLWHETTAQPQQVAA